MSNIAQTVIDSLEETDLSLGAYVLNILFVEAEDETQAAVFVLADGRIAIKKKGEEVVYQKIFEDPMNMVAAINDTKDNVLLGSDQGQVIEITFDENAEPQLEVIFNEPGAWIDAIGLSPTGDAMAWAQGRNIYYRDKKGKISKTETTSRMSGLAIASKGTRVAFTHSKGVSQWYPQTESKPEVMMENNLYFSVTYSPDSNYLIATTQGPGLQILRLKDKRAGYMKGYINRVRSLSFHEEAGNVATSGAEACILWSLKGKGPFEKQADVIAEHSVYSTCVKYRQNGESIAIGYQDGRVYIKDMHSKKDVECVPGKGSNAVDQAVSAIAWDFFGNYIAYGTESGEAKIVFVE